MQIVTFPQAMIEAHLADVRRLMETGQVAEGRYFNELADSFVPGKLSIPVTSGGAAIFALLAHQKHARDRTLAIVQSNTMRALYTVPTLLGMQIRVVESTYEDFLGMNAEALESVLEDKSVRDAAVVVYSVIGGYLSPSFARVAETCSRAGVPLIVDGAHAHYLESLLAYDDVDIAYSFYATKILPAGEGGLAVTANRGRYEWVRRFLMYDRFSNELAIGLNLRSSELASALIYRLMTDASLVEHFKTRRVAIAENYRAVCEQHAVGYIDPRAAVEYNGYKFVVVDPFSEVAKLGSALTKHKPTSAVFDTDVLGQPTALPHWCPPTYSSLAC